MKKYVYCLFLFAAWAVVCVTAGVFVTKNRAREETGFSNTAIETKEVIQTPLAGEAMPEAEPAAEVFEEKQYYLVSETGFLLVFTRDKSTICLYTHIPISDFPEEEQDKLREGIWFSSMMEVYNYLESYTS